jgi:molybdopterin-guanine dinucleotide biosynthesis protein A
MLEYLPVFGICGWSGSGKTALLEQIVPRLLKRRLSVVVVKHDVHGIAAEPDDKDSARLFRVGADIVAYGPAQSLARQAAGPEISVERQIGELAKRYDLVLVEGFKHAGWPKVWLLGDESDEPPSGLGNVVAVLSREDDRAGSLTAILDNFLREAMRRTPLFGCVLIGGENRRMGRPKHLLPHDLSGRGTWLEHTMDVLRPFCRQIMIAGAGALPDVLGSLPRIADVPGVSGPLAGLLAAMRWAPGASWLLAACDHPHLSPAAIEWLLAQRGLGVWSVLPHLPESQHSEPLLAFYDLRIRPFLEDLAYRRRPSLQAVADHPKTLRPCIPPELADAWHDVDAPQRQSCR